MASRFHPDKNFGLDTTEMMKMINEGMDWETNCVLMMLHQTHKRWKKKTTKCKSR